MINTPGIISGIINPRNDSIDNVLIDRFHYSYEVYVAANFLVNFYLQKYGRGWRTPDREKGEKGLCGSFKFNTYESHDPELNYLFRSFIFTAKASIDQGFLFIEKARIKIEKQNPNRSYPKPIGGERVAAFFKGCATKAYDGLDQNVMDYYNKYRDTLIYTRIIRNNIKLFGKANFEQSMNRPCWKIQLTRQDMNDKSLLLTSLFPKDGTSNILAISIDFLLNLAYSEVEHLLVLNRSFSLTEISRNFITEAKIADLCTKVKSLEDLIYRNALNLAIQST